MCRALVDNVFNRRTFLMTSGRGLRHRSQATGRVGSVSPVGLRLHNWTLVNVNPDTLWLRPGTGKEPARPDDASVKSVPLLLVVENWLGDDQIEAAPVARFWPSYSIIHDDGSCGGKVSSGVCVFVCFPHDMSKSDVFTITKIDTEMFYRKSWKPFYFGVERSKVNVTSQKKHCRRGCLRSCECRLIRRQTRCPRAQGRNHVTKCR